VKSRESSVCLLCQSSTACRYYLPHVWHQESDTRSYQVEWCNSCDFGYLWPRPTLAELDSFYGPSYFANYAGEVSQKDMERPGTSRGATRLADRLLVALAYRMDRSRPFDVAALDRLLSREATVCDIGCGNGRLLAELRKRGHRVVGVESDGAARERAGGLGVEVLAGHAESLPTRLSQGTFDLVSMFHVLEHCLDPVKAVANAAALLRPEGNFVVEVPNHASIASRHSGAAWFHMDAGRHVNFFTADSLGVVIAMAGLRIKEVRHIAFVQQATADRMCAEQIAWDRLYREAPLSLRGRVRRPSRAQQWFTILRAALAPQSRKYEVVAALATRDEARSLYPISRR
jgi:SAM-dependent methyltransferase